MTDDELAKQFELNAEHFAEYLKQLGYVKQKKANWLNTDDYCDEWECDNCGYTVDCDGHPTNWDYLYCPHCGAKMIERDES